MKRLILGMLSLVLLMVPNKTSAEECTDFVANLESCTVFKCSFLHPFTGERMGKSIVGYKDGKCFYSEQMPNGGKMDCAYTDSLRKAVVAYHKDLEAAAATKKSVGTSGKWDSSGKVSTKYTIDGKQVENPLQEALNNGQCIVSGYENLPARSEPKKK